jgi:hypothetical protein
VLPKAGEVDWPQEPFRSQFLDVLKRLEMARFTRKHPKLLQSLMLQFLELVNVSHLTCSQTTPVSSGIIQPNASLDRLHRLIVQEFEEEFLAQQEEQQQQSNQLQKGVQNESQQQNPQQGQESSEEQSDEGEKQDEKKPGQGNGDEKEAGDEGEPQVCAWEGELGQYYQQRD